MLPTASVASEAAKFVAKKTEKKGKKLSTHVAAEVSFFSLYVISFYLTQLLWLFVT